MADAARHGADSGMDIADQKQTFAGFLTATVWCVSLILMTIALLTLAFAMGQGWFAGLAAFAVIGIVVGVVFKLSGAWWAMLIAACVLMGAGGAILPPIFAMVG